MFAGIGVWVAVAAFVAFGGFSATSATPCF